MPESSTLSRENISRGEDQAVVIQHSWTHIHVNDIFIETTKATYPTVETAENKGTYENTTMILGMPYRHGPNNMTLVANLGNVLRDAHPKKWKKAFAPGRVSYFVGDDGRPGTQIIVQETSATSVDIQMVGREGMTSSDKIPRSINTISLVVSDQPLESAIAITQADIAKILHLVDGMQKDMKHKEYNILRYKLLARSILWLSKLYTDDGFLEKQRENLYKIHNSKALNENFSAEDMRNISISHYTESIYDKYNTYLAIIPSQYILLPDAIKKDFDFFIQAVQDMQAKTQKVKDLRMSSMGGNEQDEMIKLLDNLDLNLVQRNSRFHDILQDMCKHPELQKRLQVFDY
jgi:hypothetical protein